MKARLRSLLVLAVFVVILIAGIWALPVLVDRTYAAIKEAEEAARIAALPTPNPLESIFDSEAAKTHGFETMAKGEYADYYFTINSMDSRFIFIEAAEAMLRYMTDELGVEFQRPEICVYDAEEGSSHVQFKNEIHFDVSDISSCWFSFSALFEGDVPGWYPVALYNYLLADNSVSITAEDALRWYDENKDSLPPMGDFWLLSGFFPESDTAFEALMSITAEKFASGLNTYEEIAQAIGFNEDEDEEVIRLVRPGEFRITSDNLIIICDTESYIFDYATLRKGIKNVQEQISLARDFLMPAVTEGFWLYQKDFPEFPPVKITLTKGANTSNWAASNWETFDYTASYDSVYYADVYAGDVLYYGRKVPPSLSDLYRFGIAQYLQSLVDVMNSTGFIDSYWRSNMPYEELKTLNEIYRLLCDIEGINPGLNDAFTMMKAEAILSLYLYGITMSPAYFTSNSDLFSGNVSAETNFVRYIYEAYGRDDLFRLSYKKCDPQSIVGKTMEELVDDWKADINYDEVINLLGDEFLIKSTDDSVEDNNEETGETEETGEESDGEPDED